jgi:hypothetical protein
VFDRNVSTQASLTVDPMFRKQYGFSFADAKLIRVALECMKRDFNGAGAVIDLEGMEIKFVKGK